MSGKTGDDWDSGQCAPGSARRRPAFSSWPRRTTSATRVPVKRPVLIAAATAAAVGAWWWTDSAPYPYAQRWLLDLPLPFLTNRRLDALLAARPGQRVLEIGPGTSLQALQVAGCWARAGGSTSSTSRESRRCLDGDPRPPTVAHYASGGPAWRL